MWSHVDFTTLSSAGVAEILARAKSVPLYFEARTSGPCRNDDQFHTFRKELQACIPRIRHLSISAECAEIRSTIRALESPAPTLEYLSLSSADGEDVSIPDTLFDGSAPRLSWLKLRHCSISWKWPLLKSLKYLEIIRPFEGSIPNLAIWLDALAEMTELKSLTLNRTFPNAPSFPSHVERTVTLPSLTHFDIVARLENCVFTLAHLDLPALTHLSLDAIYIWPPNSGDLQKLLLYVARYTYGTHHSQPLQSMLIRNNQSYVDLLAWAVPDIGVEVHESGRPTLLGATLAPRLALSFRCTSDTYYYSHLALFEWLIAGLPLDSIETLAAQDLCRHAELELHAKQFWLHISPSFPQLRRVRLSPPTARGFINMLLEDGERPPLPSLTELIVVDASEYDLRALRLRNVLRKRVEQGVPLEVLDLRMCCQCRNYKGQLRRLNERFVVNVLCPESYEARKHMRSLWKPVPLGVFLDDDREDDESDSDSEDEEESDEE